MVKKCDANQMKYDAQLIQNEKYSDGEQSKWQENVELFCLYSW